MCEKYDVAPGCKGKRRQNYQDQRVKTGLFNLILDTLE